MAIKNIVARGVGFAAGSVKWIVTAGFSIGIPPALGADCLDALSGILAASLDAVSGLVFGTDAVSGTISGTDAVSGLLMVSTDAVSGNIHDTDAISGALC